ncbi:MAG: hypothetical protein DMG91_16655 [Acidobacteria bacterium]|jgi:hypothetical protein|nr:MAG: hypothetical protein DMG91_16655 [Acidobacteriota bacterium]
MNKPFAQFVLLVTLAASAVAQQQSAAPALRGSYADTLGFPGQSWTTIGNLSPIERNNFYLQSYMEQNAAVFSAYSDSLTVTPYVALGLSLDTQGLNWNNKAQPRFGIRINKSFRHGVVSIGSGYAYEKRFNGTTSSAPVLYLQDWFGWQSAAEKHSRFPGSSWFALGNISPVERGNIIGQGYITQGVVARKFSNFSLVPYAESTIFRDTKGFDWDNKILVGGGVKAVIPRRELYTEVGLSFAHEKRFDSGRSASGLTFFTNFSFEWNLLGRKAGR